MVVEQEQSRQTLNTEVCCNPKDQRFACERASMAVRRLFNSCHSVVRLPKRVMTTRRIRTNTSWRPSTGNVTFTRHSSGPSTAPDGHESNTQHNPNEHEAQSQGSGKGTDQQQDSETDVKTKILDLGQILSCTQLEHVDCILFHNWSPAVHHSFDEVCS